MSTAPRRDELAIPLSQTRLLRDLVLAASVPAEPLLIGSYSIPVRTLEQMPHDVVLLVGDHGGVDQVVPRSAMVRAGHSGGSAGR